MAIFEFSSSQLFPVKLTQPSSNKLFHINFGIPQTEDLSVFLKMCKKKAQALCQIANLQKKYTFPIKERYFLACKINDLLNCLHKYRISNPQNSAIIQTIFDIHDRTFYSQDPLMRQQAQIATISGFLKNIPMDMSTLCQLMDRMALVEKPNDIKNPFREIVKRVLNVYEAQNYQQKDTDLAVAYRLRALIQMMAMTPNKKTLADYNWLRENASKLSRIQPRLKGFASQFSELPSKKRRAFLLLPNEPAFIYSGKTHCSHSRKSKLDRE